ncbi:MAG: transposase [Acidimicrobiia bacterium]|nr:transposase [Acidimicrobiia bacterium]
MTTDNCNALAVAAQQRSHETRHRAIEALRDLDAAGEAVTFTSVARTAGVSRSWLYRQPDLCSEIDRLRTTGPATATIGAVPSAQRATTESQSRRLEATLDEIRRLKAENHQLREQVAKRFGQQRADGLT